ncbi:hypothetical protein DEU56DRAFT_742781, partial [Suillus clintonianus]|uniref:uncharacterized protein n=1 Tax=Suillus clintonianus TaxID=1904413 RepID=UPI001B864B9B
MHRQAQEAFHLQQQQARHAQDALHLQQQIAEQMNRQAQDVLQLQQQEAQREAQRIHQQDEEALQQQEHQIAHEEDVQRAGQQAEEDQQHHEQVVREREERLEEALQEYNDPESQEQHAQDEERRRNRRRERRQQRNAEDQNINQVFAQRIPIPDGGQPYTEPDEPHSLGSLDAECPNCHALHFSSERLTASPPTCPRFGMCCLQGQVSLPTFPAWPPELQQAYTDRTFVDNIRKYNSALAFTSVGVDLEHRALQASGPNAFRIHRSLHHLMGSLIPEAGVRPSYAQLYIYDPEEATNIRAMRPENEGLNRHTLRLLHDMLYRKHPYAPL